MKKTKRDSIGNELDQRPSTDTDTVDLRRRNVTALVGAALGALAFSGYTEQASSADALGVGLLQSTLTGSFLLWADTIAELRNIVGSDTRATSQPVVVVGGYYAVGDGGGGVFYWDRSSSTGDNAGTIIVPTGSRTGRWLRLYSGDLNVKWFGAKGDASQDDAPFIQNAINVAQANTAATNTGNTVLIPPGRYMIVAPAGSTALAITDNNVCLVGAGGPPNGGSQLLVVGSGGADCGILIERTTSAETGADYTQLRNLSIVGHTPAPPLKGNYPRDLIVVHANNVTIANCYLVQCLRYGILIESNTAGSQIFGVTSPTVVGNIISDNWRLSNLQLTFCSSTATGQGTLTNGAAVYVHGWDTNAGFATGVAVNNSNISFVDVSPAGGTWVACYSQVANVGYIAGTNNSSFIGCGSEGALIADAQFAAGHEGAVVAGTLVGPGMTRLARAYSQEIETEDRTGPTTLYSRLDLQDGRSFQTWNAANHQITGWYWGDSVGAHFPKWYVLSSSGNKSYTGLAVASESVPDAMQGDLWLCGLQWWLGPGAGLQATRMQVTYGASPPSTANRGDICINTAPTASGPGAVHLWRCVVGGTPATWAAVPLI